MYESFISPILPELDAAAQEHSDLQAEIVQHVYSTMWYFQTQECNACMGTGNVVKDGKSTVCSQCEGSGQAKKSPYKDMILKPSLWDNQGNMPVPPAGYVVKPTEAAKLLDERVATHIYRALSAINMEFLAQRPLNESGTAKEVDRDELNNFVYSVAYHLVENVLQPIYFYVNEWRYKNVITDPALREKMLPHIPVPERYDLLTENIVGERLKQAIDGNFSSEIIKQLELEYVNKCFATNPEVRNVMNLKQQLDPFTGLGIEDKQNLYLAGDVAQRDFILSVYIDNFVNQAMENDDDFLNKEFPQQKSTIDKLVDEKVNEMKASTKIKNNLNEV